MAALSLAVAFACGGCTGRPSVASGSTAPGGAASSAPSDTEDDLSASGAPTVHGTTAAPGSGTHPGPTACRSGDPLANVYHPNRLHVVDPCRTVSGTVMSVRAEADGDVHFDLALDAPYRSMLTAANGSGQHGWLVVEIVPADEPGCTPGTPPKPPSGSYDYGICTGADEQPPAVGSHVVVTGPYVLDEDHGGWAEIHPVWAITASAPAAPSPAPAAPATSAPAEAAPPPAPAPAAPPPASGSCTASMSDPTPGDGGEETLRVTSNLPNEPGTATAHYRTTDHPFSFQTDGSGAASVTFSIGTPTPGYTVEVDVQITGGATCSTSFTPQ